MTARYFHFILLMFMLQMSHVAMAQDILWAEKKYHTGADNGRGCAIDYSGNIIYTAASDPVFGKVNKNGGTVFSQVLSTDYGFIDDAEVDNANNIYVSGFLSKTGGGRSAYLAKYDSTGKKIWSKTLVSGTENRITNLALDGDGNVIAVGHTDGNITIAKFDKQGKQIFSYLLASGYDDSWATDVEVDLFNNIYVSGRCSEDSIDFDPDSLGFAFSKYDGPFLAKYDSAGNFTWLVNGIGHSSTAYIDLDGLGNIYMAGSFWFGLNFTDQSANYIKSKGATDFYVAKFSTDGLYKWQQAFGGNTYDYVNDIEVYNDTAIYFAGNFRDTISFGSPALTLKNPYREDPFIARIDSSGWVNKLLHFPATSFSNANDIEFREDRMAVVGSFEGDIDFDTTKAGFDLSGDAVFIAYFCMMELGELAEITGPDTICAGTTDTLTYNIPPVKNAEHYQWLLPPNYTIVGVDDSNAVQVVLGKDEKTESIRVVASGGCAAPDTSAAFTVVIPTNKVSLIATQSLGTCLGDTVEITANKEGTYALFIDSVYYDSYTGDTFLLPGIQKTFKAYATYLDDFGCTQNTPEIQVQIVPLPNVNLVTNKLGNEVCTGETITFTATGATDLSIFKNGQLIAAGTYTELTPTSTDEFYAIGINNSGCISYTDTLMVNVKSLPVPGISCDDSDLLITDGQQVTFTARGGDAYNFLVNGTVQQSGTDSVYTLLNAHPGDEVFAIVYLNGCSDSSPKIKLGSFTSIEPLDNEPSVKLYPSPASSEVNLLLPQQGNYLVVLHDHLGRRLKQASYNAEREQIVTLDITQFAGTVMFVKVISEKGELTFKLPLLR